MGKMGKMGSLGKVGNPCLQHNGAMVKKEKRGALIQKIYWREKIYGRGRKENF